jgi:hypothetical protein
MYSMLECTAAEGGAHIVAGGAWRRGTSYLLLLTGSEGAGGSRSASKGLGLVQDSV